MHPERSERVARILARLEADGVLPRLTPITAAPADRASIEAVHHPAYIARVEDAVASGELMLDSMDTGIGPGSFGAALEAAGAALQLCDAAVAGTIDSGFAAMRPPGHHAEFDEAMGFCLFNNIAIAARHLQRRRGLGKVLIVDWDLHHGNGTQHAFFADPSVFYTSLHQYPWYPGTGAAGETGTGAGLGTTLNFPMRAGAGDAEYLRAFTDRLLPAAAAFRPEAILVSAGFDAHRDDPLGAIALTDGMYTTMTRLLLELKTATGALGPISLLEGGYHMEAMPRSASAHLAALLEGQGKAA